MTVKLNTALRNTMADLVGVNLGATATLLRIYSGTQPATADTAPTGTLLATIPLDTAWSVAVAGNIHLTGPCLAVNATATGTAGWGRLTDGATYAVDGTVGVSGTDFIVNTTTLTIGAAVNVTALNFTIATA